MFFSSTRSYDPQPWAAHQALSKTKPSFTGCIAVHNILLHFAVDIICDDGQTRNAALDVSERVQAREIKTYRERNHPAMEKATGRHVSNSQIRCFQCGASDVIPSHALASSCACGRSTTVNRVTAPEYNTRMFRIPTIGNPRGSRRRARVEMDARGERRCPLGGRGAKLGRAGHSPAGWLAGRLGPFLSCPPVPAEASQLGECLIRTKPLAKPSRPPTHPGREPHRPQGTTGRREGGFQQKLGKQSRTKRTKADRGGAAPARLYLQVRNRRNRRVLGGVTFLVFNHEWVGIDTRCRQWPSPSHLQSCPARLPGR